MYLIDKQITAADNAFEESNDLEGVTVSDSEGWETDGANRLLKRFSYWDEETDGDDERSTFCVNFIPNTDKVKEAYVNW